MLLQLIGHLLRIESSFVPTGSPTAQSRYDTYLQRLSNIQVRKEDMDESHVVGDAGFNHFVLAIREFEDRGSVEFEAAREQESQERLGEPWAEAPYEPGW